MIQEEWDKLWDAVITNIIRSNQTDFRREFSCIVQGDVSPKRIKRNREDLMKVLGDMDAILFLQLHPEVKHMLYQKYVSQKFSTFNANFCKEIFLLIESLATESDRDYYRALFEVKLNRSWVISDDCWYC